MNNEYPLGQIKKYLYLGYLPDPTYIYWWNLDFFKFSGKNYIILCILKSQMPFKMRKIIFFPEKKIIF